MFKKVLLVAAIVLALIGAGLMVGANYAIGMVHDQLAAQKITFPPKTVLEDDNPALVAYADAKVDSGKEAKAYSEYINGHLQKVANGQTYSEVSSAFQKDKTNEQLAGQRQTLFMGETLRGLLLSAYGWGLVGQIALVAAYGVLALALGALALVLILSTDKPSPAPKKAPAKSKKR